MRRVWRVMRASVVGLAFMAGTATAYPGDPKAEVRIVTAEDISAARDAGLPVIDHLFGDKAELVRRFNRLESRFVHPGRRIRVPDADAYEPLPAAFPLDERAGKHILIVLDRMFLAAYEDGVRVMSFPVITGKKDYETPAGSYAITRKDADHASDKYPEPDGGWPMPWAIRFHGTAYWIHEGDMTGVPSSHGCVRLFGKDAETLYMWAEIGTKVTIMATLPEPPTQKADATVDPLGELIPFPVPDPGTASAPSP